MFLPVFPLALHVTIERLRTLSAFWQVVAVFAAVETLLDVDPHGLFVGFFLPVLVRNFTAILIGFAVRGVVIVVRRAARGGGAGVRGFVVHDRIQIYGACRGSQTPPQLKSHENELHYQHPPHHK